MVLVKRRLVFARKDSTSAELSALKRLRAGTPLTASELRGAFGNCVQGTNAYFGVNSVNQNLSGFYANTLPAIQSWIDIANEGEEFTIMLGIEPNVYDAGYMGVKGDQGYHYVLDNLQIIRDLADQLKGLMQKASDNNATMRCVVRYASEMNAEPGNEYGGYPDLFKKSHAAVHHELKSVEPKILFSFSPGISQGKVDDISDYWPGDDNVDLAGCTWYYSGNEVNKNLSKSHLDWYFKHFSSADRPPCIDELAGSVDKNPYGNNEASFENMHAHLTNLSLGHAIPDIEHVTDFCGGVWGAGVKLAFLCTP